LPVWQTVRDERRAQDVPVHLEDGPRTYVRLEDAFFHVLRLPLELQDSARNCADEIKRARIATGSINGFLIARTPNRRGAKVVIFICASRWNLSPSRSEEHTSELQSRGHIVCRLLHRKQNMYPLI